MSGEPIERDSSAVVPIAPALRGRQASIEERRRLVAESLQVGNPGNRARELPDQADPRHDCQIELRVDEIRPYEHNPRRANNAKFEQIKESIRSTGIRNPLTVTRRPGERQFIVEAGGNTRLLAVQQLWTETRDPRFERLPVLFRPWRSEGHVLVAHLIENEQRGDLTFWDKANGIMALKARLEEDKERQLSLRQLEEELKLAGFAVNTATLAQSLYATARLRLLGDAIPALTGLDVKTIQPRLNLLRRYAEARGGPAEELLYEAVFEPVFRQHADSYRDSSDFDAGALCGACEDAFARHLNEDPVRLRMVLDALAQAPQVSREALRQAIKVMAPDTNSVSTTKKSTGLEGVAAVSSANSSTPAAAAKETRSLPQQVQGHADSLDVHELKLATTRFDRLASQPFANRAWSMLALASARLDPSVRDLLPEGASGAVGGHPISLVLDADFLDWLFDGRNEAATAFWDLATLVRRLPRTSVSRSASADRSAREGTA